jgi:dihydroxyacetone kinase-like protein
VEAADEALPGPLLVRAGMIIANTAASTMGTLVATGFLRGGKAIGEAKVFSTAEAAAFFKAMTDGIMQRGKTQPGNKTIVDAIQPAAIALEQAAAAGMPLADALELGWKAACAGNDAATGLKARHGRAAYFQDESIGKADPGCAVGVLILQGFWETSQARTDPERRPQAGTD